MGLHLILALSIQKHPIWSRILAVIITQKNYSNPCVQTPSWILPAHALTPKYSMLLHLPYLWVPRAADCHHWVNHGRDPAQLWSAVEVIPCFPSELDFSYASWHCFYSSQTNYFFHCFYKIYYNPGTAMFWSDFVSSFTLICQINEPGTFLNTFIFSN